ncbi:MAG: HAMP domain-containing protein [Rhodospirillales bacterium]|nr:HAMP domain-containing protein [Rhodospirillales bacterium]
MTPTLWMKRILPKGLLGRSLLIIVIPLVLVQIVAIVVFYERHWSTVTRRLAQNLAGDVATVIEFLKAYPRREDRYWILDVVDDTMGLYITLGEGETLPATPPPLSGRTLFEDDLALALAERISYPTQFDANLDRWVEIRIQLPEGVLHILAATKRLASSTTYIFVMWMAGTALLVFAVATIFMRNQVKSVRRLAGAVDAFGKGIDVPNFKPEGAAEVRQAATAFTRMRDRIQSLIDHRTAMLAGVSHDLRTPLTRMKLQLAMMETTEGVADLRHDLDEMTRMIEGYLAFARGAGGESPVATDLNRLLEEVVGRFRKEGGTVDLHCEEGIALPLRIDAFRRCLNNLIGNARRYARNVWVRAGRRGPDVEILIDDDGPGIPAAQREEVFKPFLRLESSRNPKTGGVGLGLTIARDIVRGHGGDVVLEDSPLGGLRVRLRIPV